MPCLRSEDMPRDLVSAKLIERAARNTRGLNMLQLGQRLSEVTPLLRLCKAYRPCGCGLWSMKQEALVLVSLRSPRFLVKRKRGQFT